MYGTFSFLPHRAIDHGARSAAGSAEAAARDARAHVDLMRSEIERLLMITEALWTIMKEQHGCTDEDLAARVTEIDMRDGKLDGRVAKTEPRSCPVCGRTVSAKRPVCIYCGAAVERDTFGR